MLFCPAAGVIWRVCGWPWRRNRHAEGCLDSGIEGVQYFFKRKICRVQEIFFNYLMWIKCVIPQNQYIVRCGSENWLWFSKYYRKRLQNNDLQTIRLGNSMVLWIVSFFKQQTVERRNLSEIFFKMSKKMSILRGVWQWDVWGLVFVWQCFVEILLEKWLFEWSSLYIISDICANFFFTFCSQKKWDLCKQRKQEPLLGKWLILENRD